MTGMNSAPLGSKLLFLLCFFCIALLPVRAFSLTMEGHGVSSLQDSNALRAREDALGFALSSVVTQAAEMLSPGIDPIFAERLGSGDVRSYIKSYRIQHEYNSGTEYKVWVEADVDTLKLGSRIRGVLTRPSYKTGKPTVSITVFNDAAVSKSFSRAQIKREIAVTLIGNGYTVLRGGGQIQLIAHVGVKKQMSRVGGSEELHHTLSTVLIKAVGANGQDLAQVSESAYLVGKDARDITSASLRKAAKGAAGKLLKELEVLALRAGSGKGGFELAFWGVMSYRHYRQLDSILSKSLLGVDAVEKRVFKNSRVSFIVALSVEPEEFARVLTGLNMIDFSLILEGIHKNRIDFTLIPKR